MLSLEISSQFFLRIFDSFISGLILLFYTPKGTYLCPSHKLSAGTWILSAIYRVPPKAPQYILWIIYHFPTGNHERISPQSLITGYVFRTIPFTSSFCKAQKTATGIRIPIAVNLLAFTLYLFVFYFLNSIPDACGSFYTNLIGRPAATLQSPGRSNW